MNPLLYEEAGSAPLNQNNYLKIMLEYITELFEN